MFFFMRILLIKDDCVRRLFVGLSVMTSTIKGIWL